MKWLKFKIYAYAALWVDLFVCLVFWYIDLFFLNNYSETAELVDMDWDNLGFAFLPTDYMYIMKCARGGDFSKGELQRFGNIEMNPSAGVLNYGQVRT